MTYFYLKAVTIAWETNGIQILFVDLMANLGKDFVEFFVEWQINRTIFLDALPRLFING